MTDRKLLEMALDALEEYCENDVIWRPIEKRDALRARLATCDRCGKVNSAELHTCTPPQREWVRLTEEEHTELAIECGCLSIDWVLYGEAVERKLKEKNGG